jgi:hypothetical protein
VLLLVVGGLFGPLVVQYCELRFVATAETTTLPPCAASSLSVLMGILAAHIMGIAP